MTRIPLIMMNFFIYQTTVINKIHTFLENFNYKLYIKEFRKLKKLGEGGFGVVYLGKHSISGEEIAVKIISVSTSITADKVNEVFKEAKNLQKLNHPNIIKLQKVFMIDHELYMMVEYFGGGDLNQYMKGQKERLSVEEVKAVV